MKLRPARFVLAASLALASCTWNRKIEQAEQPNPIGPAGTPLIRSRGEDSGTPVVPGNGTPQEPVQITPEEEIVFTDPDNPDADLPELSAVLSAQPRRRGPWEESETIARKRAGREGKPLLIWFTDSKGSPMCKALSQELFNLPDFNQWAGEKLVRLRVDSNYSASDFVKNPDISLDEKGTREVDAKRYVERLKKQYKVLGQPTLIMVHPDGSVIGRYRGYQRGQGDYTWGLLKQGETVFQNSYRKWRTGLESKGYREWSDRNGRKVFAKLARYSGGYLILIEPDGTRCKTSEAKLSDNDRQWIADQKKLRGL
jgi:thioredoxin-related protein